MSWVKRRRQYTPPLGIQLYYWWPLTDALGSSSAVELIRGNTAFPATDEGVVTFGEASFATDSGTAIACEGSYLYTTIETGPPLLPTTDFSQAIWFQTAAPGVQGLMSGADQQQGTAGVHNWDRLMYIGASGKLNYGVFDEATLTGYSVQSLSPVNDGAWHHAVGSVGPAGLLLFLDGELVDSVGYGGPAQDNYPGWWRIGSAVDAGGLYAWPDGPGHTTDDEPFTGSLAQCAIYAKQLSDAQVAAIYASVPFSPRA